MPNSEMIEERLRFLEIDQDVIDKLRDARQLIEPELDRMLGDFYSHILDEPQVRRILADEKAIERARAAQKDHWLQTLFDGQFKSAYFDKVDRIGKSHARIGLTPNLYIGGYSQMLAQFVRHIAEAAPQQNRDAGPIIEALCKAVLLDLDLVIQCYLEAKDESMLELLKRATVFAADMEQLNSELGLATEQLRTSTDTMSEGGARDGGLANLKTRVEEIAGKVKQMDERVSELKTRDRLYVAMGTEKTGTLAKLKAMVLGD